MKKLCEEYNGQTDYYGYVYLILDQKYNKVYVGQTVRKVKMEYWGSGKIIKNILNNRGKYFLKKTVLGVCYSKEDLLKCELECKYFFNSLNSLYGYNLAIKDESIMYGRKHTEETKNKMRLNAKNNLNFGMKNKKHSKKSKQKMSESSLGRVVTEETKQKMSISGKGRIFTEEHKRKISEKSLGNKSFLGHRHSEETKEKMCQYRHTTERKNKISESNKGKIVSEETRKKLSIANKGRKIKPFTDEHKRKLKEARKRQQAPMLGKHFTEEHKRKISESHKGKKMSKESIEKREETKRLKRLKMMEEKNE